MIAFFRFLFFYSLRSLGRNSRRSTITIVTVAMAAAFSVVAHRYAVAVLDLWKSSTADYGTAHVQFASNDLDKNPDVLSEEASLAEDNSLEFALKKDTAVEWMTRRLRIEGLLSTGDRSVYFVGFGIEPENEMRVSPLLFQRDRDKGNFLSSEDPTGVTVGAGLAQTLDLKLGDSITLIARTMQGSTNGIDGIVKGIVDLPFPELSKRIVYVPMPLARRLVRIHSRYTTLAVKLHPDVAIAQWVAAQSANANKLNVRIKPWWEIDPVISDVEKIWYVVLNTVTALLFLSTALSVTNIIFMLVNERTIELGTLMALGSRPRDVLLLVCSEAFFIGMFGGVAGIFLGNLLVLGMHRMGVPFESPFGGGYFVAHPTVDLRLSLLVAASAVLICLFAAQFPARKAARIEPVRAFRGQIT